MPLNPFRVVLDTNILVRAFINFSSGSGRILQLCEQRRVVPLLSDAVLHEYRLILADPKLCSRYPKLEAAEITAWSDGGETVPENLQTLCQQCNAGEIRGLTGLAEIGRNPQWM